MPANAVIQFRQGTAAEWTTVNPVLSAGEPGFETDTGKIKIGNGTAAWGTLGYLTSEGTGVTIEEVQDNLGTSFLVAGTGISLTYDDAGGKLTITNTNSGTDTGLTLENIQDNLGTSFLVAGDNVQLVYDDVANTLRINAVIPRSNIDGSLQTVQLRRANATDWTTANPVLAAGEVGVESDTGNFKIGNGTTAWNSLAYTNTGTSAVNPLQLKGAQVKLVYRSATARWEFADGTVPNLTGRTASVTWEGTATQIPVFGTGDTNFRVGDTAHKRPAGDSL